MWFVAASRKYFNRKGRKEYEFGGASSDSFNEFRLFQIRVLLLFIFYCHLSQC